MFKDQLKEYVTTSGLVTMRPAGPGIHVLKYKKKVFYHDLWNQYLEHCRGTIVDHNFDIVSYPFTKIYNYGIEKSAPVLPDDTPVTAFRKVNGFMVACTFYNGDVLVSTTGSTDSPYVAMAREMMLTHQDWQSWCDALARGDLRNMTVMFECVHPQDPHIIPEKAGMYVLGYRENVWGSHVGHDPATLKALADIFSCFCPESHTVTMSELRAMSQSCRHEGYVGYTADGQSFKIKSPWYLTSKWVARNPRTDKLTDTKRDIKLSIDEEYHGLVDAIRDNIVAYTAMTEQERLAWVRGYFGSNPGVNAYENRG
jgi:hypothetical protein